MDARESLKRQFEWAFVLQDAARSILGEASIRRSLLVEGPGFDTEFSGGAAGWEVAAGFARAAFAAGGFPTSSKSLSACEAWQQNRGTATHACMCLQRRAGISVPGNRAQHAMHVGAPAANLMPSFHRPAGCVWGWSRSSEMFHERAIGRRKTRSSTSLAAQSYRILLDARPLLRFADRLQSPGRWHPMSRLEPCWF